VKSNSLKTVRTDMKKIGFLILIAVLALFLSFGATRQRAQSGTFATVNVPVGGAPGAVAVNPVTNKTYLGRGAVIDGADNSVTPIPNVFGTAVVVNKTTNKIYFANLGAVTVVNGNDNSTTTVPGIVGVAIAVNEATNRIYVADADDNTVTVIDGTNNSTTTITGFTNPTALAVNQVTNKIYVANNTFSASVTVIDGADNSTTNILLGPQADWSTEMSVQSEGQQRALKKKSNHNLAVLLRYQPSRGARFHPLTNKSLLRGRYADVEAHPYYAEVLSVNRPVPL